MEKRNFIKGIGACFICSPLLNINKSLANEINNNNNRAIRDYSNLPPSYKDKLAPAQERYKLTDADIKKAVQNNVNILPQNYKQDFWDLPRKLHLRDPRTKEQATVVYYKNGNIDPLGYHQACYFLRDPHAKLMTDIDLKLLDLMCAVQTWTTFLGSNEPMIVTSGFRSSKTNNRTEGAVKNSQHISGKAVDFIIPNLSPNVIGKIAKHFQAGGVGIYLDKNFTHLDTDRIRTWTSNKKK